MIRTIPSGCHATRRRNALAAVSVLATSLTLLSPAVPRGQVPQENRSRAFGPGACGPGDPTYVRLATETGGQPFFLSPAEIAQSSQIMFERSRSDDETILWASAVSENVSKEFTIPVDSSLRRLSVSASFDKQGGILTLFQPNGTASQPNEHTRETRLNCAHVVTIETPEVGEWRAQLAASGRFWLLVHGSTDLSLMTSEFVTAGGRPGHEGLSRIHGQPLAGAPATLRAVLADADVKTVTFALFSLEGMPIQQLEMTPVSENEFVGTVVLPAQPFRVAAGGTDLAGLRYQRMYSGLFHAEQVEVAPATSAGTIRAGATTAVSFVVRNVGPATRFRIVAANGRQLVTHVEPQSLQLAEGAEATVTVWLAIPSDLPAGTGLDLTVTATSDDARATSNGVSVHLVVEPGRDSHHPDMIRDERRFPPRNIGL